VVVGARVDGSAVRSVGDLVRAAAAQLDSPVEARWVVAHAAALRVSSLTAHLEAPASDDVRRRVDSLLARRVGGEPLQYVLGTWAFRNLELRVDTRALIPRPETEHVTTVALRELRARPGGRRAAPSSGGPLVAVDLGAGTGAIALSLAVEHHGPPDVLDVWATERSAGAFELLVENLAVLSATDPGAARRVRVARGSWFAALPGALAGAVHLIVSNPPYVSEAEWAGLDPVVRDWEPKEALVAGAEGLESIDELLTKSPSWLAPGGALVLEIAPAQAHRVTERARALGYGSARVLEDLAGRPRVLVATAGR
jgi:release factor glutamine methyltransferase